MNEKFKAYAGIGVPSPYKLESGELKGKSILPILPPTQQSIIKAKELDDEVAADIGLVRGVVEGVRSRTDGVIEEGDETIILEVLKSISKREYQWAYNICHYMESSIASDPDFLKALKLIAADALYDEYDGFDLSDYFPLLYMLGSDFDVDSVPMLREFIELVFDTYYDEKLTHDGPEPLRKLIKQFGSQIAFDTFFGPE